VAELTGGVRQRLEGVNDGAAEQSTRQKRELPLVGPDIDQRGEAQGPQRALMLDRRADARAQPCPVNRVTGEADSLGPAAQDHDAISSRTASRLRDAAPISKWVS